MNEKIISKFELTIPIERSIQAELLLLLGQQPSHGYELIQRLNEAEFKSGEADPATVYRNLRCMDKEYKNCTKAVNRFYGCRSYNRQL